MFGAMHSDEVIKEFISINEDTIQHHFKANHNFGNLENPYEFGGMGTLTIRTSAEGTPQVYKFDAKELLQASSVVEGKDPKNAAIAIIDIPGKKLLLCTPAS